MLNAHTYSISFSSVLYIFNVGKLVGIKKKIKLAPISLIPVRCRKQVYCRLFPGAVLRDRACPRHKDSFTQDSL